MSSEVGPGLRKAIIPRSHRDPRVLGVNDGTTTKPNYPSMINGSLKRMHSKIDGSASARDYFTFLFNNAVPPLHQSDFAILQISAESSHP